MNGCVVNDKVFVVKHHGGVKGIGIDQEADGQHEGNAN
jgi:hypothetical protein